MTEETEPRFTKYPVVVDASRRVFALVFVVVER